MKFNILLISVAGLVAITPIATAELHSSQPIALLPAKSALDSLTTVLSLEAIHPDEPVDDSLEQRLSLENSLTRVEQIGSALASFRQLTETSQNQLGQEAIASINNTDWETQNLGFHNWLGSIEGTLKKQDLEIKRLELELARQQFNNGELSQTELDQKTAAYEAALQAFQAFWNRFSIAD